MIVFDPRNDLREIYVVGTGGTGSQVARTLARTIYHMQSLNMQTPKLFFVDPDVVEAKNVGRQMFAPAHVGRYKAEVLARSFNMALGLDIVAIPEAFDHDMLRTYGSYHSTYVLIIGCVDNAAARKSIAEARQLWLDCGNHYDSGQVVLGSHDAISASLTSAISTYGSGEIDQLPYATTLFPNLLEDEPEVTPEPDLSCAELMERGSQHLLINEMVAMAAGQYLYKLLMRQPIHHFMSFVDVGLMHMRAVPINELPDYMPIAKDGAA